MPTYEYICNTCGTRFDYFQSINSPALLEHPDCNMKDSTVKRIISGGSGLIFKGTGFYLTDYKNKGKKNNTKEKSSNKKESKINNKKNTGKKS